MKTKLRGAVCSAALLAVSMNAVTAALAQTYPTKPIRYIVAFPAGGTTDLLGRLIGQKLTEAWGQPVIMDNRAGAAGSGTRHAFLERRYPFTWLLLCRLSAGRFRSRT